MAADHYDEMAAEYRKEGQRLLPRTLLFAVLLIMTHVLDVKPSDLDAGGLKIAVSDAAVIRGGIALVFYYYLWSLVMTYAEGHLIKRVNTTNRFARNLVATYRQPYRPKQRSIRRTPQQVKRQARTTLGMLYLFSAPFATVLLGVIGSAFVLGLSDVYSLGEVVLERLAEPAHSIEELADEARQGK